MDNERLEQVIEIFDGALNLAARERDAYLQSSCSGDRELRAEVERLLLRHEQAGDFLESPVLPDANESAAGLAGRQIGPYKMLRELGSGGMGVVYLAERADDVYHKEVAVKLVWPGMQRADIVRRFKRERQILAKLNHPNIARLLDGGTSGEGWPYFVMEYVDGVTINEYCASQKLDIPERLKLIRTICAAVEYAHQHLIVHRDLKPSNILVTADGTIKLLDFGIAKVLKPEAEGVAIFPAETVTRTGLRLMTPEYASPEQVSQKTITTASDIYNLGLLLYELLTGEHPHNLKHRPLKDVIRVICEEEPDKPSVKVAQLSCMAAGFAGFTPEKMARRLAGDLDNVVLKALQKDVRRRYQTVEQLSKDLHNYLTGQPVMARPATWHYRAEKYIKRNKTLVTLATALLMFLFISAGVTLWQLRLSQAREREQRRQLYAADMRQAGQDWAEGNLIRLSQLLEAHRPGTPSDLWRGLEWFTLWKLLHTEKFTLLENDWVPAVLYTPDGKHLLTSAGQGRIEMWDAQSGQRLEAYATDHPQAVLTLMLTPDGRRLITTSARGHVRIRDFRTRQVIAETHSSAGHRAWPNLSPDGKQLAVYWSPQVFKLYDTESGQFIRDLALPADRIFERSNAAFYAPDGRLYCLARKPRHWELWDVFARRVATKFDPQSDDPKAMETSYSLGRLLSHDGRRFYLPTFDFRIRAWDTNSGKLLHVFSGHQDLIETPALSADDRLLVSGSNDGTLRFWDTQIGRQLAVVKNESAVYQPVFSPDGNCLAAVCQRALRAKVWEVQKLLSQPVQVFEGWQALALTPDGKAVFMVSSRGDQPRLVDLQTGQTLITYSFPYSHTDVLKNDVTFSQDGRLVVFGEYICETRSGRLIAKIPEALGTFAGSAFSPDGKLLATSVANLKIVLRDTIVWRELPQLIKSPEEPLKLVFSPDSRLLSAGDWGNVIHIWDAASGQDQLTLRGHRGPVHEVCFSSDGQLLASASVDFTVKLWSVAGGRELRTLYGHGNSVNTVAFAPDGRRLASAGDDKIVRLWDTQTGTELTALHGHTAQIWELFFTPDGQTLVSTSQKETSVWRAATREEVQAKPDR